MTDYLIVYGLMCGAFTLGWVLRGLIVLGDVRELEELRAERRETERMAAQTTAQIRRLARETR